MCVFVLAWKSTHGVILNGLYHMRPFIFCGEQLNCQHLAGCQGQSSSHVKRTLTVIMPLMRAVKGPQWSQAMTGESVQNTPAATQPRLSFDPRMSQLMRP